MAVMDRLAKLDSSLQRGLDNSMAALFGGKVVPEEIEELVKQEAQDSLVVTDKDEYVAPNVYAVGVSSKDLENLSQNRDLPVDLADQLMRYVRNKQWFLDGPVVVRIAEESGLRTGQLRVSSYIDTMPDVVSGFDAIVAEPKKRKASRSQLKEDAMSEPNANQPQDPQAAANPEATTVSLLLQDGSSRTYLVHEGSNILGRSNDSDFRLPDTGVSRQHAEITWDGQVAVLVDLQSTNGTTVNDEPVENWMLADGDVITLGHSNIEVRIVGSQDQPQAGANEPQFTDSVAHPSTEYFRP
ncbi:MULTISPECIES: DUF3662 and FHA domain-containing protein [unclassified Corynebacterium]|uniref:DUF3662 and FHA domain-containing protein n=1 Tax=unclassified Corynebacterium TaxID=2624378 RepID=UPI001EF42CD1|nr:MULTISPECIES: DUF3662 and FHA domain-containing protein [unclassified Corynebacterium]MCG7289713.1 DUF3662 and FHA domain-containing protein [Corynebacterium sp. ACRPZ]MCG7293949.1 DUF3662 and FHA domain-containing protein [Corynebacterium sp. ACRPY]MDL0403652.1 DUF3662 and FHA domain-containing protein [Corynebacterium lehmanniae]